MLKNEYSKIMAWEKGPCLIHKGLFKSGILPKFINSIPFYPAIIKPKTPYFKAFEDLIRTITTEGLIWRTSKRGIELATLPKS